MNRISPEHLAQVGKFVSEAPGEAISIGALARQLGVRYPTAKRRLEAYAAANGLSLQSGNLRAGVSGPAAATWYLRPPAETSVRIDPRVRSAFMAKVPRDLEDAVSSDQLLAKVREGLPPEITRHVSSSSFAALLSGEGVVTTSNGLVYLERAAAKTQSVAAVERGEERRQPSPPQAVSDDADLGLSPEILRALKSDELLALRLLARTGTARTSELVLSVGHSPDRVAGMMSQLRRKLHELGAHVFVDEDLPDGETMFRYLTPEER